MWTICSIKYTIHFTAKVLCFPTHVFTSKRNKMIAFCFNSGCVKYFIFAMHMFSPEQRGIFQGVERHSERRINLYNCECFAIVLLFLRAYTNYKRDSFYFCLPLEMWIIVFHINTLLSNWIWSKGNRKLRWLNLTSIKVIIKDFSHKAEEESSDSKVFRYMQISEKIRRSI